MNAAIKNIQYFDSRPVSPVGKSIFSKLKKAISIKGLKKVLTLKNIVGTAASFALPGVGGLLVNGVITGLDVKKAEDNAKKVKAAAAAAVAKDKAAAAQITDSFNSLKQQSNDLRKSKGLPPNAITLPDIYTATQAQIEKAFSDLQADALAITEDSPVANPSAPTTSTSTIKNHLPLIAGGVVALFAGYMLLRKK